MTLEDAGGNTVTGTAQNVTLAIQINAGPGGVLSGTLTEPTVSGVAIFSGLSINVAGTGYELTATGNTVDTSAGTVVSSLFNITPGTATRMIVTLAAQTFTSGSGNSGTVNGVTAGTPFTISKLTAVDALNNIVTSYSGPQTITYSGPANSPNGTVPIYTTAVTFANGQSTTTLTTTLFDAQTTTISATDGTLTGVPSQTWWLLTRGRPVPIGFRQRARRQPLVSAIN